MDGSSLENRAGSVNINGRKVTYSASSADFQGTEGGAVVNDDDAQTAAAKPRCDSTQQVDIELEAKAQNGNGFLEPF